MLQQTQEEHDDERGRDQRERATKVHVWSKPPLVKRLSFSADAIVRDSVPRPRRPRRPRRWQLWHRSHTAHGLDVGKPPRADA